MKHCLTVLLAASSLGYAADFFPLSPGNSWVLESNTGAREEISAGFNLLYKNGETWYRVSGYRPGGEWIRRDARGQIHLLDPETESDVLLTRFEADREPYRTELGACAQWARVAGERVPWGERGRQLPALRIVYEGGCADNALAEELYLENIGLVRRTVNTIAGPVQYDLTRVRVGSLVYTPGAGTSFEIAMPTTRLLNEEGKVSARVTLRLTARQTDPLTLEFRDSQRFDLTLQDESGRTVWRWSEGRVFTPATARFQVVDRSWTESLTLPGLAPGFYLLTATLTNTNPGQFAASIPLRID